MVGTDIIFFLMSGTALLTFLAMYFFAHNQKIELKQKNATLNAALCILQEERAKLIVKSDGIFMENTVQQVQIAHLNEEIRTLYASIERLESDNQEVVKEYKSLESLLWESDSSNGVYTPLKVASRFIKNK